MSEAKQNKKVIFRNLGTVDYEKALAIQKEVFQESIDRKLANRNLPEEKRISTDNYILHCEHNHVYTLGKSGSKDNLLINTAGLQAKNASFYEIGRGGDITYHGPGQLTGYPILDLDNFFTDIHKYLRFLEEAVILTLKDYGLTSGRINGLTGVWLDHEEQKNPRKICAFGVKASRWVTMHGFALNINADLSYFNNIVPCGIQDKAVTSMEAELGRELDMQEVGECLLSHVATLFGMEIIKEEVV